MRWHYEWMAAEDSVRFQDCRAGAEKSSLTPLWWCWETLSLQASTRASRVGGYSINLIILSLGVCQSCRFWICNFFTSRKKNVSRHQGLNMYVYKNMHVFFFLHKLTFVKLEHVCTLEEISLPMLSQFSCTTSELEKIQFSREIFGKKKSAFICALHRLLLLLQQCWCAGFLSSNTYHSEEDSSV